MPQHVVLNLLPHPANPNQLSMEKVSVCRTGAWRCPYEQHRLCAAAPAGGLLAIGTHEGPEFRLWLTDCQRLAGGDNAVLAPGFTMSTAENPVPLATQWLHGIARKEKARSKPG